MTSADAARNPWLAKARAFLLPGRTTSGHYQIELACESCHTSSFTDKDEMQQACTGCHGAELKEANDTHPLSKFTDPRNADRLEKLDATLCVTCHVEHRPRITHAMGVTLPKDLCFHCHAEIAADRPSHAGMASRPATAPAATSTTTTGRCTRTSWPNDWASRRIWRRRSCACATCAARSAKAQSSIRSTAFRCARSTGPTRRPPYAARPGSTRTGSPARMPAAA
jgi:hypothetical protein